MNQWQRHTPDGVFDLLPADCAEKRRIEQIICSVLAQNGYWEIETSGLEYYDVYAAGSGTVPQEELFKLIDQRGRILCLRYDGTVPAARVAATLLSDGPWPQRLYYLGQMYRFNESGGGRQRAFSQAGIELIGSRSPQADAEVIAIAIRTALQVGISDLQVSIGQVGFFKGLLEDWGVDARVAQRLPQLVDSKQVLAIEEIAGKLSLSQEQTAVIKRLASSQGGADDLDFFAARASGLKARAAILNLREVLLILEDYGLAKYVSVDLGMLQSLDYYTGIIFKGFTYQLGFPLFSGGRYDRLLDSFGYDLPATGFSIGINMAMTALARQKKLQQDLPPPTWLCYPKAQSSAAFKLAEQLRADGQTVICNWQDGTIDELKAAYPRAMIIEMLDDGSYRPVQGGK